MVTIFKDLITDETPLLGIEPSGILTFRDEYPELVPSYLVGEAKNIGRNSFLIDEFIATEFQKGNINASLFSEEEKKHPFSRPLLPKSVVIDHSDDHHDADSEELSC